MEGTLCGKAVEFLVDTGATVNVLSVAWWEMQGRPGGLQSANQKVYVADGRLLDNRGMVAGPLRFGGITWDAKFLISDIATEAIVGSDFLRENQIMVDLAGTRVIWGKERTAELSATTIGGGRCRVINCRSAVLGAGEEAILDGYLVGPWTQGEEGLVEGLRDAERGHGFVVGRSVVNTDGDCIPIRVLNPGAGPVVVYKDTTLATLEQLEEQPTEEEKGFCRTIGTGGPGRAERVETVLDELCRGTEAERVPALKELLRGHVAAFQVEPSEKGRTDLVEHKIVTGDNPPVKQPPRRLAPHRRAMVEEEVDKMLAANLIEPADGPWASPVVLVKKKDGTMRFCVDYRKLNAVTRKDAYPLPRIDDSLDTLAGGQWFSTLDLVSGYWQVQMSEQDKEKTAFTTHKGLYQFKVMPFGLCNAPSTFERLMEIAMRGLQWAACLVYLDDIVVFSPDFESHLERLGTVLGRLEEAGLKVKPSKCCLARREVSFLGHVVSAQGIATDPAKVRSVRNWPVPRTLTEVRSFLGLAGYYRAFIPQFATVAKPLSALADKGRAFRWDGECEEAFRELKNRLTSAPVLGYPVEEGRLTLDTDASDLGLGAVLSQQQEGQERALAFASRTLNKAERNYCVTRKELLAIIFGLKKFRHYLLGRKVLIRTDHAALKWVTQFKEPEGQVARWIQVLDTFDYEIQHRPGRNHGNADGLSRIPCRQCGMAGEETAFCRMMATRSQTVGAGRGAPEEDQGEEVPPGEEVTGGQVPAAEEWVLAQKADPVVSRVYTWAEIGERPPEEELREEGYEIRALVAQLDRLVIRQGVLGRWWYIPGGQRMFQVVVPRAKRQEVLDTVHGGGVVGHFGRTRSLRRCQERFYWPEFRRDVVFRCASCEACLRRKPPPVAHRAKMGHVGVGLPMERMAIDVMGPLPRSTEGFKYIVVIIDYFTKWAEAFPMRDQEAATVARVLVEQVVLKLGSPATLHSDQGTNFQSRLFKEAVRLLGIEQTRTCAFRPQSDGLVERCNRTIEALLATVVKTDQKDWARQLPYVMAAYRSSVHSSTGITPNMMMLGRETVAPLSVLYPEPEVLGEEGEGFVADLQTRMGKAHEYAREALGVAVSRQTRNYDKRVKGGELEIGEVVYYYHPLRVQGRCPKLQSVWTGPWTVTAKVGGAVYEIKRRREVKVVHYDALKKVPTDQSKGKREER